VTAPKRRGARVPASRRAPRVRVEFTGVEFGPGYGVRVQGKPEEVAALIEDTKGAGALVELTRYDGTPIFVAVDKIVLLGVPS